MFTFSTNSGGWTVAERQYVALDGQRWLIYTAHPPYKPNDWQGSAICETAERLRFRVDRQPGFQEAADELTRLIERVYRPAE